MAVTIVPRVLPMLLVNRLNLPHWFWAWLRYIPVSVIAALFFRETLLINGEFRQWGDPYLIAGQLTLITAFLCRNLFLTVCLGVALFTLLRLYA